MLTQLNFAMYVFFVVYVLLNGKCIYISYLNKFDNMEMHFFSNNSVWILTKHLSHCLCYRWDQVGGDGGAQGRMQTGRQWQLHEAEEVSELWNCGAFKRSLVVALRIMVLYKENVKRNYKAMLTLSCSFGSSRAVLMVNQPALSCWRTHYLWGVSSGIYMNAGIKGFPAGHCTIDKFYNIME